MYPMHTLDLILEIYLHLIGFPAIFIVYLLFAKTGFHSHLEVAVFADVVVEQWLCLQLEA